MVKLKIRKGDTVKVISGASKGVEGKVLEVFRDTNKAIVEGVNIVKKHQKPDAKNPQGGIIEKEAKIQISNLSLLDPKSGKPTRVGIRFEDGRKIRFAKKSGEEIK